MSDNSFAKLVSLREEIKNSEEYKVFSAIKENELSFRLFLRNYSELQNLLGTYEDLSTAINIVDEKNKNARLAIMEEITFLLHNYVSSAMSLVDHTRRLHNRIYADRNPDRIKEI
jgi:hypothetical protein